VHYIFSQRQFDVFVYEPPLSAADAAVLGDPVYPPASSTRNDNPAPAANAVADTLPPAPPAHQTMGSQPPTQETIAHLPTYLALCCKTQNAVKKTQDLLIELIPKMTEELILKVK
jgi:hypothetical protein